MRISSVHMKNFRRFTDLDIREIPASAKLVLLVGSNGSGKSSVFDAFTAINDLNAGPGYDIDYCRKDYSVVPSADVTFSNGKRMGKNGGDQSWSLILARASTLVPMINGGFA